MSEVLEKQWLVLSYFAGIDGMACSQHIDDRLPLLCKQGIMPLLLTGICGKPPRDTATVRVPSLGPSGIRFELRHLQRKRPWLKPVLGLLNLVLLPFYLLEKLLIDLDSQWSWFPLAIWTGSRLCRSSRPQLIYSTGGPASAHLAAAVIARRHGIPWIAEFQDPLVHDDWLRSKQALKISAWLEQFVCKRADAVIFLTNEARKRADGRAGLGERGWSVYPGSNPAAMPQVAYEKGDFCRFAHFGSLGGSRNLKVFLEALGHLLAERPSLGNIIRLDVFGTCDRLSLRLIEEFPVQGVVRYHGRIARSDSLVAMKQCDVLLLIQNTEEFSAETIPSKTYEYFFTGRPILALVHKNPELRQMMSQLGHTAVKADSYEDVERGIGILTDRWIADCLEPAAGGGFEVERAVNALIGIGNSIVQRSEPAAGISAPVRESRVCL
ncbi:MAG: glycosyltransferase [Oryzomonas sp.]